MHEARVRARARALPAAFLAEIARPDLDVKATHAAVAGLIVLRSVDRWVAGGCRPIDVSGARRAVDEMDEGNPARGVLGRVLDALAMAQGATESRAIPSLLEYGRALEFEAKLPLALAVYGAISGYAGVATSDAQVGFALLREAICLRLNAQFERSLDSARRSLGIALAIGDQELVARAELAIAYGDALQGRLAEAEARLVRIGESAPPETHFPVRAAVLGGQAFVAGMKGRHARTILLAHDALCADPNPEERDAILHNMGEAFRLLGYRTASRDTFLVLSCTAGRAEYRWGAALVLMLLAAQDGEWQSFEMHRAELAAAPLPVTIRIQYLSHLALAWKALGNEPQSRTAHDESKRLSEMHGMVEQHSLVQAEATRQYGPDDAPGADESPANIEFIARVMRDLREAADVPN